MTEIGYKTTRVDKNTPARITAGSPTAMNIWKRNLRTDIDIFIPPFSLYHEPSVIKLVKRGR